MPHSGIPRTSPVKADLDRRTREELVEEIEELRGRLHDLERGSDIESEKAKKALHERNDWFSLIMDIAKDAIIGVDSSERIVVFNHGAETAFGYDASEVIGQPLAMLLPERFRGSHSQRLEAFAASDVPARFMNDRGEICGLRKDGSEFPAEASISVLKSGGETHFTAVVRDITERKRREEHLRQNVDQMARNVVDLQDARDLFEQQGQELVRVCEDLARARDDAVYANHAKSQFLTHMSHELRTPLNAILGFSELITCEILGPLAPPKYREYCQDIHISGAHLLELINDILDLSKIEAGKLEIQDKNIDVGGAVEASLRFVKERASKAGVTLGTELPGDLPMLRADGRMVKQMIVNLLTNAVKFTPRGGAITVSAVLDEGLRLSIRDTGVGIAREDIPKVLEKFGQAKHRPIQGEAGTGLGLPLVKSMAELHGGTMELESEVGTGTTVTIRFPPARITDRACEADEPDGMAQAASG